jgi:hypothetical protein
MGSAIEGMARVGYAARGAVYLIVGFFAVLAAFGRSDAKDTEGALQSVLAHPFGTVLVAAIALGLLAIAAWRTVQAVRDADHHGAEPKGVLIRAGLFLGGLSYFVLAALVAGMLLGSRLSDSGGDPSPGWLSGVYGAGIGSLLVYAAAVIVLTVGLAHIVRGVRASFEKYFRCPEETLRWLRPLARFGLIARGLIFLIVAGLIVRGGLAYNLEERPGLGDALQAVQGYSIGWLLFLALALGLVAFGLYSLAEARYREVAPR